jgi:hypothetical protein
MRKTSGLLARLVVFVLRGLKEGIARQDLEDEDFHGTDESLHVMPVFRTHTTAAGCDDSTGWILGRDGF